MLMFSDATAIPDFLERIELFESLLWPAFMCHTPSSRKYLARLARYFPFFQLAVLWEGKLAGCAKAIPFHWQDAPGNLPDRGWDAIYAQGIDDLEGGRTPNALCLLSITIDPSCRKRGFASATIAELKRRALLHGLGLVVAPVRPTGKSAFPDMEFDRYLALRRADNEHFDPWIRTHERLGAKILKPAYASCTITASLALWEKWLGRSIRHEGSCVAEGMLVPLKVDMAKGRATYVEPNVWMGQRLCAPDLASL